MSMTREGRVRRTGGQMGNAALLTRAQHFASMSTPTVSCLMSGQKKTQQLLNGSLKYIGCHYRCYWNWDDQVNGKKAIIEEILIL